MRDKIKALEALHSVDLEILELSKAGEAHPKRLAEIDAEMAKAQAVVDAERARLEDNQRRRDELEGRLNEEKEKVKKWEARLTEMRTTREYSALAREVDIAKKSVANMQEEILALMQEAEGIETALIARREEYKQKEASFAAEMEELKGMVAALAGKVKELHAKRTKTATSVDKALLRQYDAIRARRGFALAQVVKGTCQGCHIALRPQLYNTVMQGHSIETCPNCNRIIYVRGGEAA